MPLALLAVPLGLFIFLNKKGTGLHKASGSVWISLTIASLSAIFIQAINPDTYSPIHLLIPFTIGEFDLPVWSIKRFQKTKINRYRDSHKYSMIGVYVGALLIAGASIIPGQGSFMRFLDKGK